MVLRRRRRDKPLEILTERGSRQSLRAKEPQEYSHIDILETHPIGTAFPSKVNDGGVEGDFGPKSRKKIRAPRRRCSIAVRSKARDQEQK